MVSFSFAAEQSACHYEDGLQMELRAQLAAGDSHIAWCMQTNRHVPEDGWRLLLTPRLDALRLVYIPEFGKNRWGAHQYVDGRWVADPVEVTVEKEPAGRLMWLVPWNDWWEGQTKTSIVLKTADRGEELLISRVLLARERGAEEERKARFYHEGKREIIDFSALPRQDYLVADMPLEQPVHIDHQSNPGNRRFSAKPPEWPAIPKEGKPPSALCERRGADWRQLPRTPRYGDRWSADDVAVLDHLGEDRHA